MELEQQEIFHNKDDTLVSKLQNQIVKLIHILKKHFTGQIVHDGIFQRDIEQNNIITIEIIMI